MTNKKCSVNSEVLIEWPIDKKLISEKIFPLMFLDKEAAGEIFIDTKSKKAGGHISVSYGDKDSVFSPNAILNYHTHPISCYISEQTVLGYFSGEDIRETIIFGLEGSIGHVVSAVEGIYICQLNPCVLENLINLDLHLKKEDAPKALLSKLKKDSIDYISFMRGFICLCVEIYFRSSHMFRTFKFNEFRKIHPEDYVKYVSSFKLRNIFYSDKIKGCSSNIKCNDIYIFDEDKNDLIKTSFEEYCKYYEHTSVIDTINKTGSRYRTDITIEYAIKHKLFDLIKDLNMGVSCIRPEEYWSDNWFTMSITKNLIKIDNNNYKDYSSMSAKDQWFFLKQLNKDSIKLTKDPVFTFFDISGMCNFKDIKKDLHHMSFKSANIHKNSMGKYDGRSLENRENEYSKEVRDYENIVDGSTFGGTKKQILEIYGSPSCPYCVSALKDIRASGKYSIKLHYYDDIGVAIQQAIHDKNVNVTYIPAIFKDGKLIDKEDITDVNWT